MKQELYVYECNCMHISVSVLLVLSVTAFTYQHHILSLWLWLHMKLECEIPQMPSFKVSRLLKKNISGCIQEALFFKSATGHYNF